MEALDHLISELTEEVSVAPKRIIKAGSSRLEPVKPDLLTRSERKRESRRKRNAASDIPSRELTTEDKLNLDAIRLRGTLDPTKFYKKKATDHIGNFQVGTVIEHPMDYYSSRATRKERKTTLVDELIADAEFKKNVRRRYMKIKATDAIKKREKALAQHRVAVQAKKKKKKQQQGKNKL